jgi:vesicle coat complex subunit
MDKTLKEVARQLCDGFNMDIDDVTKRLGKYLKSNPMSINELSNQCWEDSNEIFDCIM